MTDVSCKAAQAYLDFVRERGQSIKEMLRGFPFDEDFLMDGDNRISWNEFADLGQRMRDTTQASDKDLIKLGRELYGRNGPMRIFFAMVRLFTTPQRAYKWMEKGSKAVFSNTTSSIDVRGNQVSISIELRDNDTHSEEYFLVSRGSIASMTTLLGYPEPLVTMTRLSRGVRYDITIEERPPGKIRTLANVLTGARSAADELADSHLLLRERYQELEDYRTKLEEKVEDRTRELNIAVRKLEEAQAARDRIFANINHEIRTPLSLIRLASRRIGDSIESEASELDSHVTTIDESTKRLLHLVDTLLLLAAHQEDRLVLEQQPTDIANLIRNLVSQWQELARQALIDLRYDGPESCVQYIDPLAFERIFSNLLSNAVKYTPEDGTITVKLLTKDSVLEIQVEDTGIGLSKEFKNRIFERFAQDKQPVRKTQRGSGLGLSIVRDLVMAHEGQIHVESQEGQGTTFTIELKRSHADQAPISFEPSSIETAYEDTGKRVLSAKKPKATILVAEDEPKLRASLGEILSQHYKVLLAADGHDALEMARTELPELLVSDVGMPKMDGFELAQRFRQLKKNQLAPVVFLTAYANLESRLKGFESGAVDYILKPFEPEELLARVQAQLALREMALRLSRSERMASIGAMASGLAHEFRNPANGLVNALPPLKTLLPSELTASNTDVGALLEVMEECALQIRTLSTTLLGLREGLEASCSTESSEELCRRAISTARHRFRKPDIKMVSEKEEQVACSGPLIVQALCNLLNNAQQATGESGRVTIRTFSEHERICFEVTDDGPGIPAELRERVFDPFFTTKAQGEGTGLGLAVCRQIAEQNGGTVELLPSTQGTRVVLSLPKPHSDQEAYSD